MIFTPTKVEGALLVTPEPIEDARGTFARTYCEKEFREHGVSLAITQCNVSRNLRHGTLRGMHFQVPPHLEQKLVSCTRGAIFDVVLDLRAGSPTFGQWEGVELSAANGCLLYVPQGCAHGFQTLEEDAVVFYQIGGDFVPDAARGVRWDDPRFAIRWPEAPARVLSDKDRAYPDYGK